MITERDIIQEATDCFLTYSKEVLSDRAIPAIEDGLLRGQREILWTMTQVLKMKSSGKTKKSASIVGSTLATAYFHGDSSCYGSLCKMSLPFLMRYPLITGQGSLGTQEDNDLVASPRYTEAKPSPYSELMFNDFSKNVVPLVLTYNEEYEEPVYLPSLFPNAIVNGRESIGISLSHSSLPHSLAETCNAAIAYIKSPDDFDVDKLMEYMVGPDLPCGGAVVNGQDIREAFRTGKSKVSLKIRGNYINDYANHRIIFTSIPYRTYRNVIKEQLAKNVDVFDSLLKDFNDESTLGETKMIFELRPGVAVEKVLTALFQLTDLQSSVSYNMNFLVNGTPKMCSMVDLIKYYVAHQEDVLIKASQFDLEKTKARIHILEGLIIAIKDIDSVIKIIRNSKDKAEAAQELINYLSIDKIQADAILSMRLSALTKLDESDLLNELKEKQEFAAECEKIINVKTYRDEVLIKRITELRDKYGDKRRTVIMQIKEIKTLKDEGIEGEYYISLKNGAIQLDTKKKTGAFKCGESQLFFAMGKSGKLYRIRPKDIPKGLESIVFVCGLNDNKNFIEVTTDGYAKIMNTKDFIGDKASKVGLKTTPSTSLFYVAFATNNKIKINGETYEVPQGSKTSKGTRLVKEQVISCS